MEEVAIADLVAEKLSGEWGLEPSNEFATKVLRTTNFTNEGRLNLESVVEREIEKSLVERKHLKFGDTIIEKSGGGPKQPVGRVVFFDIISKEKYLSNNFTAILRPSEKVYPKYFFYSLFFKHLSQGTLRYQNKTTGILNLKLDRYLEEEKIKLPDLKTQQKIASILEQADAAKQKRKQANQLTEQFLQSVFLEMFGDPIVNNRDFKTERLDKISKLYRGRFSPRPRNDPSYFNGDYPFIQTGDISRSGNRLSSYSQTLNEKGVKVSKKFNKGVIVIAIVGATIGVTAILEIDVYATDSIIGIEATENVINNYFLEFVLRFWRPILLRDAPEVARPNINLEILNKLEIILPPLPHQQKFASMVEQVEHLRAKQRESEKELENLFGSLMQRYFG